MVQSKNWSLSYKIFLLFSLTPSNLDGIITLIGVKWFLKRNGKQLAVNCDQEGAVAVGDWRTNNRLFFCYFFGCRGRCLLCTAKPQWVGATWIMAGNNGTRVKSMKHYVNTNLRRTVQAQQKYLRHFVITSNL